MTEHPQDLGIELRRFERSDSAFAVPLGGLSVGVAIAGVLIVLEDGRSALRVLLPVGTGVVCCFGALAAAVARRSWVSICERGLDIPRVLLGQRRIAWQQLGGIARGSSRSVFAAVDDTEGGGAGRIPLATLAAPEFQRILAQLLPEDSPLRRGDSE